MINPMQQILGGLTQGMGVAQMLRDAKMQKEQMQRQKDFDERRARMAEAEFDLEALRAGFRAPTAADLIELQTGVRDMGEMPQVPGLIVPEGTRGGVKSDLQRVKSPGGKEYVRSQRDEVARKLEEARLLGEAENANVLKRLRMELEAKDEFSRGAKKRDLQEFGVDMLDPNTGQSVRVPFGAVDDFGRGAALLYQLKNPRPANDRPLHFTQTDSETLGLDPMTGEVRSRTPGGRGARRGSGGGVTAAMEARFSREDAREAAKREADERKGREEAMRNVREQAEGLQRQIDELQKMKLQKPQLADAITGQQRALIERKNDLYRQEAEMKKRGGGGGGGTESRGLSAGDVSTLRRLSGAR